MRKRGHLLLIIIVASSLFIGTSSAFLMKTEVIPNPNPPDLNKTDDTYIAEWWQFPLWMNVHSFLLRVFPAAAPFAAFILAGVLSCFGYRHINNKNLLEHQLRQKIYNEIRNSPGISQSEIEVSTGINRSTVRHHLMILEREEAIISSRKEWMTHYFENHHHYSYRDQDEIILSKNSVEKEIYDYIRDNTGVSRKMIAQYFGNSSPAVSR